MQIVGEGIKKAMEAREESAIEDEHYLGSKLSICSNEDGMYLYSVAANRVANIPFSLIAPTVVDLRGQLPTRPGREYYTRPLDGITGITLHYTGSPSRSGLDAVEAIAAYQVGPNAQEEFPGIAYTIVVDGDGTIYLCHDLDVRTWQNGARVNGIARNVSHVGIAYIGDYEPTQAQLAGISGAIAWTEQQLGRELDLEGHKDAYPTSCPGPTWPAWKQYVAAH